MGPLGPSQQMPDLQSLAPLEQEAMEQECSNCRFYRTDQRCTRFPPHGAEWAMVNSEDWCGEFQQGEPQIPPSPQEFAEPQNTEDEIPTEGVM